MDFTLQNITSNGSRCEYDIYALHDGVSRPHSGYMPVSGISINVGTWRVYGTCRI